MLRAQSLPVPSVLARRCAADSGGRRSPTPVCQHSLCFFPHDCWCTHTTRMNPDATALLTKCCSHCGVREPGSVYPARKERWCCQLSGLGAGKLGSIASWCNQEQNRGEWQLRNNQIANLVGYRKGLAVHTTMEGTKAATLKGWAFPVSHIFSFTLFFVFFSSPLGCKFPNSKSNVF